jgi:hypothetical protein
VPSWPPLSRFLSFRAPAFTLDEIKTYPPPLGLTQYQARGGIPTGRDASSFCFSSKDIFLPATRRW